MLVIGCGLCWAAATAALEPARELRQLHHTAWTHADGLPAAVWAIAQSRDGYLLLGTGMGLYRFDGLRFERVRPRDGDYPGANITALAVLPDGAVAIGYQKGGVSFLRDGVLTNHAQADGAPGDAVRAFALDDDGAIWVAASDGLARFDGRRWRRYGADDGLPGGHVRDVHVAPDGTRWVRTTGAMHALRRDATRFERVETYTSTPRGVAFDAQDRPWSIDPASQAHPLPDDGPPRATRDALSTSRDALIDRDGAFWSVDRDRGVRRAVPGRAQVETFSLDDGLSSSIAAAVFEDDAGTVWVGTNLGLDRFRTANAVVETAIPQTSSSGYRVATAAGGVLHVAAAGTLYRVGADGTSLAAHLPEPPNTMVAARDGALLLGGHGGLARWRDGASTSVALPAYAGTPEVWAVAEDDNGALWISFADRGVYRETPAGWRHVAVGRGLDDAVPLILQPDGSGASWLAYRDGTLLRVGSTDVRAFAGDDGPAIGAIAVVYPASGGVLFGGEFGVARFDGERFRTLPASRVPALTLVSGIVETPDGDLWFNAQTGVVRAAAADFARALDADDAGLEHTLFDFRDGLPGAAEQDAFVNTAARAGDGRLWFATSHGVAWIDPSHVYRSARPPPVSIRAFVADGAPQPLPREALLPQNVSTLQIDYTALDLAMPERLRFRYRLSGVDAGWVDAGDRRQAFYTKLPPGQYRFDVAAANGSGVWNDAGATLAFAIPPSFVQSNAFAVLCALFAAGALWLAYSLRVRSVAARIRVRLEERLGERERIARELHDTLLQGFQGLMLRFQSVADEIPRDAAAHRLMEQALERADGVLLEGRDRVRDLRAVDVHGDLPRVFAAAAQQLATDPAVRFRVTVEGEPGELHPLVRDETVRIGCEAVFNAFRHARASSIDVVLAYRRRQFALRVRDDGVGIAPEVLRQGRQGHFGLTGMRERARKIHADLSLTSGPGGTQIELVVPGRIAYASNGRGAGFARWRRTGATE
jgi:signal transduction histidine kinase/ligand-binding sensor domain-containing protein